MMISPGNPFCSSMTRASPDDFAKRDRPNTISSEKESLHLQEAQAHQHA